MGVAFEFSPIYGVSPRYGAAPYCVPSSVRMTHATSGMQTPITCAGVLTRLRKKQLSSSAHAQYEEQDSGFCTPGSGFLSFTSPESTPLGRERWGGREGEAGEGERVDFLAKLGSEKNYSPALSKIFSHLDDEDLSSASRVSKQWNRVINSDTIAKNRLNSYLNRKISNVENELELDITKARSVHKAPSSSLSTDNKSVRLFNNITNNVQSQTSSNNSQSRSQQSELSNKFNLFRQEGQKLTDGEYLSRCPRCELPAKLSKSSPLARCVNKGCEYVYCNSCLCPYSFEPAHSCMLVPPTTPRSRKKFYTVGSKTNLKSLKRCLR